MPTMMVLLALIAGLLGFAVVFFPASVAVPIQYQQYLALAALAGLDSLIGGLRAGGERKFKSNIFISGFVFNTLLAVVLAWLGELLGQDLALAAVVLLGGRIFVNLSIIRRIWLDGLAEGRTSQSKTGSPVSQQ